MKMHHSTEGVKETIRMLPEYDMETVLMTNIPDIPELLTVFLTATPVS